MDKKHPQSYKNDTKKLVLVIAKEQHHSLFLVFITIYLCQV